MNNSILKILSHNIVNEPNKRRQSFQTKHLVHRASNSQCLFPLTRNSSNVQFERWYFLLCDIKTEHWMFWTFSTVLLSSHSPTIHNLRRFDIKCTWITWIKHKPTDSRHEQMSVSLTTFNPTDLEENVTALPFTNINYMLFSPHSVLFAFNSLFRSTIYSLIRIGFAKLYSYNVLIVWERV